MKRRPLSIALRLNGLFLAILAIVLVAGGTWLTSAIEEHFQEQDRMEIGGKLVLLRRAIANVRAPQELAALPAHLDDALIGHHGLYVAVADEHGNVLYAAPELVFPADWRSRAVAAEAVATAPFLRWDRNGVSYRGLVEAIPAGPADDRRLAVGVALDIEHHQMFRQALADALLTALVVCLAVAGALTWIATRRGLAPLRDMAGVAKGISASRLDQRLAVDAVPAELVDLAASFNGMLGRLEDSFRRLNEFSADIAHELRTPVSNLMIETQVALSRSRSADDYREILYSSLEEYDRMARMIADMLFLAKADNGQLVPHGEVLDLAREADAVLEYYEPLAAERGIRLRRLGEGRISGDRLMIRRAIGNLVSNAVRHTPDAGEVTVELSQGEPGAIRIAVENPGEAIAAEHRARIFDRFYRIDPSRQRSGEGAGLGLAIARSIVRAHGGTIEAVAKDDGARFEMTLPTG
jgi:two-component system heavy metal sensor histidine kinase CusS